MSFIRDFSGNHTGFLPGIFSGRERAKSIVVHISFVMLIFCCFRTKFQERGQKSPKGRKKNKNQCVKESQHNNKLKFIVHFLPFLKTVPWYDRFSKRTSFWARENRLRN